MDTAAGVTHSNATNHVSAEKGDAPVTALITGIISDAQTLIGQQAEMFKAEVREDLRRSTRAAEIGVVGIVFTTAGVLALTTGLAHLLHEQFGIRLWVSWGSIGFVFALIGTICAATGYSMLERFNPLPDKTFNAIAENYQWKTR